MGQVMLRSVRCNPALLESLDLTGQWDISHVTIKRYCKLKHLHNQAGFVTVKAVEFEIMMSGGVWGEMKSVTPSSLTSHKISKFFIGPLAPHDPMEQSRHLISSDFMRERNKLLSFKRHYHFVSHLQQLSSYHNWNGYWAEEAFLMSQLFVMMPCTQGSFLYSC